MEQKADTSPLTRADREANTIICDGLMRIGTCPNDAEVLRVHASLGCMPHTASLGCMPHTCLTPFDGLYAAAPHIPIVSEENKQLPYEIRKVSLSLEPVASLPRRDHAPRQYHCPAATRCSSVQRQR